jgi:hypothetical protein
MIYAAQAIARRVPDARSALGGKRVPTIVLGFSAVALAVVSLFY